MPTWIFFAILSAISAALVAIFGKIGIKDLDTTLATTIRSIVMAGVLVITSLALNKFHLVGEVSNKALTFIFFSGLAGALSWLFYFQALKTGPTAAVASLDRLSVVFVLILAALFLGEGLTWKSGLGASLITLGAILMTLK